MAFELRSEYVQTTSRLKLLSSWLEWSPCDESRPAGLQGRDGTSSPNLPQAYHLCDPYTITPP